MLLKVVEVGVLVVREVMGCSVRERVPLVSQVKCVLGVPVIVGVMALSFI